MELDTNPSKIRSNLIYVSMAIILWNIAGGSFNRDLGLLGGSIKFERIEYLEYTGVVVYFYLLFRYGLLFNQVFSEFQTVVMFELATDSRFTRLAKGIIDISSNEKNKEFCNQRAARQWKGYLARIYEGNISMLKLPVPLSLDKFLFPKNIFFMTSQTEQEVQLINKFRFTQGGDSFYRMKLTQRIMAQYYTLNAVIRSLRRSQTFYEVIFPLLFALIAYSLLGWRMLKYY